MAWMFGGAGSHATIKSSWLSYKLYYDITESFFVPDHQYYFVLISNIIRVDHITSYLARCALHVLRDFFLSSLCILFLLVTL